ncbi:hypothetical protein BDN70DRAFT_989551 [Pholiota conissans]|uniref:DBF4-type domain-containing protein n=1 Tax=Pholiota conissans TaxID=109636 RepID=A0A9P5ZAH1_9AGAR|nr:hypothetical protein BDN70DRAFT_989551 [Pholiota conissans]
MSLLSQQRQPLRSRVLQQPSNPSPARQCRTVSGSKRARSPEHAELQTHPSLKRARALVDVTPTRSKATERERSEQKAQRLREREQKEDEFRRKYTSAFASWRFYIDSETIDHKTAQAFKSRILLLKGRVEDFFSSSATHFITERPSPKAKLEEKENKGGLMSPIKLRGEDSARSLVAKAMEYEMKIWNSTKLASVLDRCLTDTTVKNISATRHTAGPSAGPNRSLSRLLQTEKIHGTTERDPTQRRHDWHYFSRGSVFVLVEDIHQQLATIAAHEYPIVKDKSARKPWPVLYCHPLARNPFGPFDEKEQKRYEKQLNNEKKDEVQRDMAKKQKLLEALKRKAETTQSLKAAAISNAGGANLRKSISVSNLRRRYSHPVAGQHGGGGLIDLDADEDEIEPANASGYNPSAAGMNYIAASGNSVGITSNTGTTSTSSRFQRNINGASAFTDKFGRHVVTSLKMSTKEKVEAGPSNNPMGPPTKVPMLRKSKSTNTMKLPKRDEGAKPGYCESCRVKFEDFTMHTTSTKHRKFATNPANFAALDTVLARLQRRTNEQTSLCLAQQAMQVRLSCAEHRSNHSQELCSP